MRSKPEYLFFSGFSLQGEAELFDTFKDPAPFCIGGFSYGAVKAYKYALTSGKRVDRLQLFSPAFFQEKDAKYKRLQVMFYQKDRAAYTQKFLENCAYPAPLQLAPYQGGGSKEELEELLNFEWSAEELQNLVKNGTTLEVHLGKKDRIIDAEKALEFFRPFATVYFYNDFGHILKGNAT